jgi:hypothetical protein
MKQCTNCKETKPLSEFHRDRAKPSGVRNKCKQCIREHNQRNKALKAEYDRRRYGERKEKILKQQKEYRDNNRDKINAYQRDYYQRTFKDDTYYKLCKGVGRSIRSALKKTGGVKNSPTWSALPYTPEQLKEHLEKQFQPGMSWDNYGEWEIDHIFPQSLLPYDSLDHPNFLKCWSLDNLQPLDKLANIRKSNKIL